MAWAGAQAIKDRYGDGHFATVAAHTARWRQFTAWAKETMGIRDARNVNREVVVNYGEALSTKVTAGEHSITYAQNLLSTVNVVLEALRGDRQVRISPAALVGKRSHARAEAPLGLERNDVRQCTEKLRTTGHPRIAAVVELARELGLRLREASLLDTRAALRQGRSHGAVNITVGTKGGRGHRVDRWVPISTTAIEALERAATVQGDGRNLIPDDIAWHQWNNYVHHVWAATRNHTKLGKLHDLRAAYACERYLTLTGSPAPVVSRARLVNRETDRLARETIAHELGHTRVDVVVAYIGGGR